MVKVLAMTFAVLAGVGALLLLTAGPSVVVKGETRTCPGVIVASEAKAGVPDGARRPDPCDPAQARWTWYAAGAGLVGAVTGTGALFYRRKEDAVADVSGTPPTAVMPSAH